MIKKMFRACAGNIVLMLRKIFGVNVYFSFVSLISPQASLRTFNKGKITLYKKTEIRPNTEITARNAEIIIGANSFVNRNCMIVAHAGITIGEKTTIGPNTCIYDHDHDGNGDYISAPIVIGNNVWIGAGCIILKGVHIGDGVIIGAGTIVLDDVDSNSVVFDKRDKRALVRRSGV